MATSQVFGELVGNVAGVEIGENEDVGLASDRAGRGFFVANGGDESGVKLELAINEAFWLVGLYLCECAANRLDTLATCTAAEKANDKKCSDAAAN